MGEAKRKKLLTPDGFGLNADELGSGTTQDILYPQQVLEHFSGQWHGLWQLCNRAWMEPDSVFRGSARAWAPWCYMPINAISSFMYYLCRDRTSLPVFEQFMISDIRLGAALSAWRLTKGVYQFEQDTAKRLFGAELPDSLDTNLLFKLPEWCVYIPLPGMSFLGSRIHGVFAYLDDHFTDTQRFEPELTLVFMLDVEGDNPEFSMHQTMRSLTSEVTGRKVNLRQTPLQMILTLRHGASIKDLLAEIANKAVASSENGAGGMGGMFSKMKSALFDVDTELAQQAALSGDKELMEEIRSLPKTPEEFIRRMSDENASTMKKVLALLFHIASGDAQLTPIGEHTPGMSRVRQASPGTRLYESERINAWKVK